MVENKFIFYGVRGSYPVPSPRTVKYGGNTSSILVEAGSDTIVLDAGTGIVNIGRYLTQERPEKKHIDIFLTHYHMDHIQGIPFFEPVFNKDYTINIYCDESPTLPLGETILSLFNKPLSPIGNAGIKAHFNFIPLNTDKVGTVKIGTHLSVDFCKEHLHPEAGVLLYRVNIDGMRLVYATDVESVNGFAEEHIRFIDGADILIHDTMYFDEDYYDPDFPKTGFGHSTVSMAVQNAIKGNVKN